MSSSLHQAVLRHLAAIAITCGIVDPAPRLLEIPVELVTQVIDESDDIAWRSDDRLRLLSLLKSDPRVAVRARVAESIADVWATAEDESRVVLSELARDRSLRVRDAAGDGLASVLERASPIDRVEILCAFASSDSARDRRAAARALRGGAPSPLADLAIEVLADDDDHEVRRAAIEAAERRAGESESYRAVALRRVDDEDAQVRRVARRIVSRNA